jgi:hypothetical protein
MQPGIDRTKSSRPEHQPPGKQRRSANQPGQDEPHDSDRDEQDTDFLRHGLQAGVELLDRW